MATSSMKTEHPVTKEEPRDDDDGGDDDDGENDDGDDDGTDNQFDSSGWQVHDDGGSNENVSSEGPSSENMDNRADETVQVPHETMIAPDETGKEMDKTMNKPEQPSKVPDETLNVPDDTTNEPDQIMNVPIETMSIQGEAINVPGNTRSVPHDTMKEQDEPMNVPYDTMNTPDKSMNVPDEPVNVPDENMRMPNKTMNVPVGIIKVPPKTMYTPLKIMKVPPKTMNSPLKTVKVPAEGMTVPAGRMNLPGAQLNIGAGPSNMTVMLMYKCNKCGSLFQTMNLLQEHCEGRNGKCNGLETPPDRLEGCKRCRGVFFTNQLPAHTTACLKSLPFACESCGKGFNQKKEAESHQVQIHKKTQGLICNDCGKEFTDEENLQLHKSIHMRNKQAVSLEICDKCKICFQAIPQNAMEAHMLTHSGEEPFVCNVCGKGFALLTSLRGHCTRLHSQRTEEHVQGAAKKRKKVVPDKPKDANESVPAESEECNETVTDGLVECSSCKETFPLKKIRDHKKTHVDNWPYSCEECGKGFAKKDYLRKHNQRTHGGQRPYECDYCGKAYLYPSHLKYHMATHMGEKKVYHEVYHKYEPLPGNPFLCKECGWECASKAALRKHFIRSHRVNISDGGPFICKVCGKKFITKSALESHFYRSHKKVSRETRDKSMEYKPRSSAQDRVECKKCFKSFSVIELKVHMLSHSDNEPFVCRACGKEFTMRATLRKHWVQCGSNRDENRQSASDKLQDSESDVSAKGNDHQESEPDELEDEVSLPDKYKDCPESDSYRLMDSEESVPDKSKECQESAQEELERCYKCHKKCSPREMPDHMKTHQEDKPVICKECGRDFASNVSLKMHCVRSHLAKRPENIPGKPGEWKMRIKSQPKPKKCFKCHKTFPHKSMKNHLKTHSEGEPFTCDKCGMTFPKQEYAQEHYKRAHEMKLQRCEYCPKAFLNPSNLKAHLIIHTKDPRKFPSPGDRFPCQDCGVEFEKQDNLRNHRLIMHIKEKPHKCKYCGKGFVYQSHLKSHVAAHTQVKTIFIVKGTLPVYPLQNVVSKDTAPAKPRECHGNVPSDSKEIATAKPADCEESIPEKVTNSDQRKVNCQKCSKKFSPIQLQFHMLSHLNEEPLACKKKIVTVKDALQMQLLQSGQAKPEDSVSEKPQKCLKCHKKYPQRDMLNHLKTHANDEPSTCTECGRAFTSKMSLKMHRLRMHSGNNPQRVRAKAKQRNEDYDPEQPKKCMKCHKTFPQREIIAHMTTHAAEEPFVCDKCGHKFQKYGYFQKHLKRAHAAKQYKCQHCEKAFVYPGYLKDHLAYAHAIESGDLSLSELQWFVCKDCGKRFSKRDYLRKHNLRVHLRETRHECQQCGKGFLYQCMLRDHIKIHTGGETKRRHNYPPTRARKRDRNAEPNPEKKREHLCPVCGKLFFTVAHLNGHMLTHSDVRALKCRFCSKTFKQRLSLKFHMRVHMGERPYVCSVCKWPFYTLTDLKKHENTHKGDSLVKCTECGIGFKNKYSLTIHMDMHAEPGPHDCHLCKSTFLAKRLLVEHLRKFHEKDPMDTKQPSAAEMKVYDDILQRSMEYTRKSTAGSSSSGNAEPTANPPDSEIPTPAFPGDQEDGESLMRFIQDMASGGTADDEDVNAFPLEDDLKKHQQQNIQEAIHTARHQVQDLQETIDGTVTGYHKQNMQETIDTTETRHQAQDLLDRTNATVMEYRERNISESHKQNIQDTLDESVTEYQEQNIQETYDPTTTGHQGLGIQDATYSAVTRSGVVGGVKTELLPDRNLPNNLEDVLSTKQSGMLMAFGKRMHIDDAVGDHNVSEDVTAEEPHPPIDDQGEECFENQTAEEQDGQSDVSPASRKLTLVLNHKCNRCHSCFQTKKLLKYHLKGRNGKCHRFIEKKPPRERPPEGHLKCRRCSKWYSLEEMPAHKATHQEDRPFLCEECGKRFPIQDSLRKHMIRHTGKKRHFCEHCKMGFYYMCNLKRHVNTHTGEKKYICEHCGRTFKDPGSCRSHVKTHTTPFPCSRCNKILRSENGRRKHEASHDFDLTCKQCGKTCISRSGFVKHRQWHELKDSGKIPSKPRRPPQPKIDLKPERPCQVCGKLFKTVAHLESHMLTHTDVRGLKCDICHKTFKQRLSLKFHKNVHMGERPYVCSICKWAFFSLTSLKKHERTHRPSKGKPLVKCPECGIGFSHKFSLTVHMGSHSDPGPHNCHLCKSTFIAKSILVNHLRKFHENETESSNVTVPELEAPDMNVWH